MSWYRTGIIADGRIVVAAMYCADHDPDSHGTGQQLGTLTVADVARIAPRRAQRAAKNLAAARAKATAHSRVSANLAGASSHTHTHALLAGVASEEAETLERLAALAR